MLYILVRGMFHTLANLVEQILPVYITGQHSNASQVKLDVSAVASIIWIQVFMLWAKDGASGCQRWKCIAA